MIAVARTLDARAVSYLKDQLRLGKDLSGRILRLVDVDAGSVTAFAPQSAPESVLYALSQGGITEWGRDRGIRTRPDDLLIKAILEHLQRGSDAIIVIEDETRRKGDRALASFPFAPVARGTSIYHLLKAGSSRSQIASTLKKSSSAWLNIVVFSYWDLGVRTEMSEDDVIGIAGATQKFAVSAYDGESWILWERAPVDVQR